MVLHISLNGAACLSHAHFLNFCARRSLPVFLPLLLQNFGTMALLPVLGKHLNMYLPLLLVVHCTLIWWVLFASALCQVAVGMQAMFAMSVLYMLPQGEP